MKAVILAGGFGTRIGEETATLPKPMIEIGGRPIIWHIMQNYAHYGITDFVLCLGYKGHVIKHYFAHYYYLNSDLTFDMREKTTHYHRVQTDQWRVTMVDTGENSMTGGRLGRIRDYVKDDEAFCMTYGDGLSDVDIGAAIAYHKSHGKLATVTAVQPPGRFGILDINDEGTVTQFKEKPPEEVGYINGGFFVLSPKTLDLVESDSTIWERAPMEKLARDGQLKSIKHHGFWHCIDTLRDKQHAEELWSTGNAPWKVWK
jgi:glucose-1-phosphate cytidylyltransferase